MAALAAHCTQLTSLRLEQTYVGDEGVQKILAACPLLQELRVAGCSTHSWMLPAEYMFAGLSVSGLSKMAAGNGVGAKLTSLDLSCLAYEQQQEQPAEQALLLPAAAAAVAALEAAAAATAAAAAVSSPASSSGSSSSSADGVDSSSSSSYSSVATAIARLSLDSPGSSNSSSSSARSRCSWNGSPTSSTLLQEADAQLSTSDQADSSRNPGLDLSQNPSVRMFEPLIPADWCSRLNSLSLDWLKVPMEGRVLQGPLQATLMCCSSLAKLSLVGYNGIVDALLSCVADAGAAVTQLNLQHSQVRSSVVCAFKCGLCSVEQGWWSIMPHASAV
jgi:hypothetical protein